MEEWSPQPKVNLLHCCAAPLQGALCLTAALSPQLLDSSEVHSLMLRIPSGRQRWRVTEILSPHREICVPAD